MSSNDITGDRLISKANTKAFEDNFDRIFKPKCPVCNGDGVITQVSDFVLGTEEVGACPGCEGTGKVNRA